MEKKQTKMIQADARAQWGSDFRFRTIGDGVYQWIDILTRPTYHIGGKPLEFVRVGMDDRKPDASVWTLIQAVRHAAWMCDLMKQLGGSGRSLAEESRNLWFAKL